MKFTNSSSVIEAYRAFGDHTGTTFDSGNGNFTSGNAPEDMTDMGGPFYGQTVLNVTRAGSVSVAVTLGFRPGTGNNFGSNQCLVFGNAMGG